MALEVFLLKQPYEISFSGNPMPFSFTLSPYRETEKLQDIRLQVRILIEQGFGSGIFQEVKSQNFYPNANGMIELDVQTIVDPYLEFYLPNPNLQKAVQAMQQRTRYKLSYLLQKNGAVVGLVQESPVLYAIKGGMAYQEWHPTEFFSQLVLSQKLPLNFLTKGEKVGPDEKRFLFWTYPYANNSSQSIRFLINLNDGSNIIFLVDGDGAYIVDNDGSYIIVSDPALIGYDLPGTVIGGKWSIFCCPVGFNQTGLNTLIPAGSYAVSYSVGISAGSVQIVAPVTYTLDHRNFYNTHQICYRNSVGGLETIRLRGQVDFEADYTMQQAQRIVPPAYFHNMTVLSQSIQDDNEETAKFKGDTGFVSNELADKMRDCFLSPERYEVYNERFIPVTLSNKNVKFYTNKDSLVSVQLEWSWAFTNAYYTPVNLMPAIRTCPAVEKLIVKQVNKKMLQVMYALLSPYEIAEVQIIIGSTTYTYTYRGNSKTVLQPFTNPATTTPVAITVKCRTVCNENSNPVSYGPFTTLALNVIGDSLPVVNDDNYTINAGYNSAVTLPGSVLANDYDPDGDSMEAVAATGSTNAGGSYTIDAAGNVTYQPPSSTFSGIDYFSYSAKEISGSIPVTGKVNITVGIAASGVFAKIIYRNVINESNAYNSYSAGEVWVDFFGDPAGTQPLDISSMNLTINFQTTEINRDRQGNSTGGPANDSVTGTGLKMKLYEGELYSSDYDPSMGPYDEYHSLDVTLLPGTGYTAI